MCRNSNIPFQGVYLSFTNKFYLVLDPGYMANIGREQC